MEYHKFEIEIFPARENAAYLQVINKGDSPRHGRYEFQACGALSEIACQAVAFLVKRFDIRADVLMDQLSELNQKHCAEINRLKIELLKLQQNPGAKK